MNRVFISYAKEDVVAARRIFADLRAIDGVDPWFDESSLLPGITWEDDILRAIADSQFVIVLLSAAAVNKNGFMQTELRHALERMASLPPGDIFILPVRLEACEPSYPALQRLHRVDMFPDWQAGVAKILETLTSRVQARLGRAFGELPPPYASAAAVADWAGRHAANIAGIDPTEVLAVLDRRYQQYENELDALAMTLRVVDRLRPQSTLLYLRRLHELLARLPNHPVEFFYANGLLLEACKGLPGDLRTLLLRDVFSWYVERIGSIAGNAFPQCLALVEVTKHYMVQTEGRYHSDAEIAMTALKVLRRYDLLFADIVLFYALRSQIPDVVASLAPLFKARHQELGVDESWLPIENWLNVGRAPFGHEQYVNRPERAALLLCRAGVYLGRSDDTDLRKAAEALRGAGFLALSRVHGDAVLNELEPSLLYDLFCHLETLADSPPSFFANTRVWRFLLDSMQHECAIRHLRSWRHVRIEGRVVGGEVPGGIYFGR